MRTAGGRAPGSSLTPRVGPAPPSIGGYLQVCPLVGRRGRRNRPFDLEREGRVGAMTTGAPLTAAHIVATEADELAEAWRECCYRHHSQQPLDAKAMLGAVDWTLRHREARMWASDPVLESVAESFARHANSVEV